MDISHTQLIETMSNLSPHDLKKISCKGTITSKKSKYCGQTFDVTWAGHWGFTLKVQPIDRNFTYSACNVTITDKSIENIKKKLTFNMNGATDFFDRSLKAGDIIFYDGDLFKILFFVESTSEYSKNVAVNNISNTRWETYFRINQLKESVLIDDPLLLLKI